jgi:superfamily II DNA or RNA helicase
VLVGRIHHGEALFELLDPVLTDVGFVHSKMSIKKSDEALDAFESGKTRVLIATYKMLAEGFDYQPANRLFLTGPYKGRTRIEQACGRIERTYPGKTDAYVYDYVDKFVGVLNRQAEVRLDVYEANDMPVTTVDI